MSIEPTPLAAILAMAVATYLTRIAGPVLTALVPLGGRAKIALEAVPAAVLMAGIAPMGFMTGPAETVAAALTAIAAARLPMIATVAVGMVAVVGLRALLG